MNCTLKMEWIFARIEKNTEAKTEMINQILETICSYLDCQPGDILEFIGEENEKEI